MSDVNMPKLSDTMEEGTIVEWKKKDGDQVKTGDVLAEVESDKATFDLEADSDGVLKILVEQGVPAKIGAPIARIGEGGATEAPKKEQPPPKKEQPAPKAEAQAKTKEPEAGAEPAQESAPPSEAPPPQAAPQPAPRQREADGGDGQIKASPLAKRLAAERGVDLASIQGTGPEGRIVKEDVLAASSAKPSLERRRVQPGAARPAGPDVEAVEPNRMQATIARRMAEAKSTIPEFQVTVEARVDD
ncbi:MAG TPA: biotin/lipoyl-containing protein, partial [Candidatus Dormibacteraeota bacterium]|nr:biotin/lipoyl-containing protein [Candidatus Dormibacteraeota bacterium]